MKRKAHTFISLLGNTTATGGYGMLYNWYAVEDARNIAPTNCHVPTETEMITLRTYLGGESVAGGKVKESGFSHWDSPNTGADNSSGFTALPAGYRDNATGDFNFIRKFNLIWNTTNKGTDLASNAQLNNTNSFLLIALSGSTKKFGGSVRCICDTSSSTITDIDGNVYDTIVIGTQRWLVQNLRVTRYRNGDSIPEVTDNSTWIGLTSGARCYYDNDPNNL